jgi:hypothetical protein
VIPCYFALLFPVLALPFLRGSVPFSARTDRAELGKLLTQIGAGADNFKSSHDPWCDTSIPQGVPIEPNVIDLMERSTPSNRFARCITFLPLILAEKSGQRRKSSSC